MRLLTERQVVAAKKLIDVMAAGADTPKEARKVDRASCTLYFMLDVAVEKLLDKFPNL